jgi:hypothetical protein
MKQVLNRGGFAALKNWRSRRARVLRRYDFPAGGGHWIFDATAGFKRTLKRFCPAEKYKRDSAVYFPEKHTPISLITLQHNIGMLGKKFSRMPKRDPDQVRSGL